MHNITNSRKHKMALSVISAAGFITVMTMVWAAMVQARATAQPLIELVLTPEVDRDCIPNYADCMDMEAHKPCCRQQQLEVGQVLPEDFICFRFGEGTCQPLSSVAQLDKYAELVKFANENNVVDMIEQYREDVEVLEEPTTVSVLDAIPIERDDGLTKPDDATTEPDAVLIEPDDVPIERDDGLTKPDDVTTEPDAVLIERDDVTTEPDAVQIERDDFLTGPIMIFH